MGISGFEIPFTAEIVETGKDEDGDPETAVTLNGDPDQPAKAKEADRWPPSLRVLWRALQATLADCGSDIRPMSDGPLVRACDLESVRTEFYPQYPVTDGKDEEARAGARKQAFRRAIRAANERELITSREVDNVQMVWMSSREARGGPDPRMSTACPTYRVTTRTPGRVARRGTHARPLDVRAVRIPRAATPRMTNRGTRGRTYRRVPRVPHRDHGG